MTIPRRPLPSRQRIGDSHEQTPINVMLKAHPLSTWSKTPAAATHEKEEIRATPDRNAGVSSPFLQHARNRLFWSLQRLFEVLILRPQEEKREYIESTPSSDRKEVSGACANPGGWLPFVALADAGGLFMIASAFTL